jgi:hypothetical protein
MKQHNKVNLNLEVGSEREQFCAWLYFDHYRKTHYQISIKHILSTIQIKNNHSLHLLIWLSMTLNQKEDTKLTLNLWNTTIGHIEFYRNKAQPAANLDEIRLNVTHTNKSYL